MIEINNHEVVVKTCPNCQTDYCVQHGGQKSGGSPYVHVPSVGESGVGSCSLRCGNPAGKDRLTEIYQKMDLDYDDIFPSGYVAPARKLINNVNGGDN